MQGRFSIFATVFVDFHYSIFPFLSCSRRLSLFQLPSGIWHLPSAIPQTVSARVGLNFIGVSDQSGVQIMK